jgi:hypothetical protein
MDLRAQEGETADSNRQRKENVEMAPHPNRSSAPPLRSTKGDWTSTIAGWHRFRTRSEACPAFASFIWMGISSRRSLRSSRA